MGRVDRARHSPAAPWELRLGELKLTGEERNATVLFSDIRSFTALSERLAPPDVVRMLNEYFNVMVEIVFKNDGFLNKFIGDALMAVYNVPITEQKIRFRKKGVPGFIRLRLTLDDEPRINELWRICIDGEWHEGTTDGDGYLQIPVPPEAKKAKLVIGEGELQESFDFNILRWTYGRCIFLLDNRILDN